MRAFPTITILLMTAMSCFGVPALADGIDLSWNDCAVGDAASSSKNFSCSPLAPTQSYSLMLQFKSPTEMPNFVAMTAYLDVSLVAPPGPMPPFWHYESGGCNFTGVELFDEIPHGCAKNCYGDPWGGGFETLDAIAGYVPDYQQPGRARFVLIVARPFDEPFPIKAHINYFGAELRFNNLNRTSCLGCDRQVALLWSLGLFESLDGSPAVQLTDPDKFWNCVTINGEAGVCFPTTASLSPDDTDPPCAPTPVTRPTWGRLKTLYR